MILLCVWARRCPHHLHTPRVTSAYNTFVHNRATRPWQAFTAERYHILSPPWRRAVRAILAALAQHAVPAAVVRCNAQVPAVPAPTAACIASGAGVAVAPATAPHSTASVTVATPAVNIITTCHTHAHCQCGPRRHGILWLMGPPRHTRD